MAYAMEATSEPKRETIGSVVTDFEPALERLAKLYLSLERIGDHLEGSRPQNVAEATKLDTPPHCLMDNLRKKHRTVSSLAGQCEDAAMRIQNALGI